MSWYGFWPGRGPFSYLPPWQRPGWIFGRGACWRLFNSYIYYNYFFTRGKYRLGGKLFNPYIYYNYPPYQYPFVR